LFFLAIFLKQYPVLCQKQSSTKISHSKNVFHITRSAKGVVFQNVAVAGNMDVAESSSLTLATGRKFSKFCLKRFKIGVFFYNKNRSLEGFFEIFKNTFVIFRNFFENIWKDIQAMLRGICGKAKKMGT